LLIFAFTLSACNLLPLPGAPEPVVAAGDDDDDVGHVETRGFALLGDKEGEDSTSTRDERGNFTCFSLEWSSLSPEDGD